ncbi:MAG TPA: hypothetical protein PK095_13055, partial [Myxococcota bacterium]|nr:hypothetical protein [Myxococcota bacterium]
MLCIRSNCLIAFVLSLVTPAACTTAPEDVGDVDGPAVAIEIAPLGLAGVTNATWNLTVRNAALDVVMSRNIDADDYGDGAGSVSYVAPCDASSNDNTVSLTLLALYSAEGEMIAPTTYVNPGTLSRSVTCSPNADTPVTFNVTIVRDAQQGFFDVAVTFDDLFCSAKLDCIGDNGQPLKLLHNSDGTRDDTVVLGLACTGGADGADTQLYLDNIVVNCPGNGTGTVNPAGGPGILSAPDLVTGGVLSGAAVYRGEEQVGFDMLYWNVSLGFKATFPGCVLTTRATASDGPLIGATTPAGWTYPYIQWNVPLTNSGGALSCTQHPISGTPPGLSVVYTAPNTPETFAHGFGGTTCPNTANTSCGCPAPVDCIASNQTCDSSDPTNPSCVDARRLVFVSRFLVNGTMGSGGLAAADALCQTWANNAAHTQGLVPGATFKAWLSDDSQSPSTRLNTAGGPFVTVNTSSVTTIIANDWADLTDGTLDAAIGTTEEGINPVGATEVWTGTAT